MNWPAIANVIGTLLVLVAASLVPPLICAMIYAEGDVAALVTGAAVPLALGAPLWMRFRRAVDLGVRDAAVAAVVGWTLVSAASALPFVIHGSIPSFVDAVFEMMSGYTTTGATILEDIEAVPHGLLLWRSETHLLGGMGFLTLIVLFLPRGIDGLRLFRAESSPGQVITRERVLPRTRDVMVRLWGIYLGLTALQTLLLVFGGMSFFDSLCHAFGTVSTSGYSPKNASIGHYDSAWIDWVTIVFMFAGGLSFVLLLRVFSGDRRALWINTELRWYLGLLAALCGGATLLLWTRGGLGFGEALTDGTFQVVSLLTTTGFTTTDYELWPQAAQMLLVVACFVGACAGSTTSGIKVVHFVLLWKFCVAAIKKMFFQPLAVISVRLDRQPVAEDAIHLAVAYFAVNVLLVLLGGIVMTLTDDLDAASAMSATVASLMNIGPGFGAVGPSHTFAPLSDAGKVFLAWLMLVGRLEMFTALVVFYPAFWRR